MAALLLTYSNQFSCMKIVVTTLEQPHYLMLHAECEINLKLSNEILTKTLACHGHGRLTCLALSVDHSISISQRNWAYACS